MNTAADTTTLEWVLAVGLCVMTALCWYLWAKAMGWERRYREEYDAHGKTLDSVLGLDDEARQTVFRHGTLMIAKGDDDEPRQWVSSTATGLRDDHPRFKLRPGYREATPDEIKGVPGSLGDGIRSVRERLWRERERRLDAYDPDWRKIVRSYDFALWASHTNDRARRWGSDSADEAIALLEAYKADRLPPPNVTVHDMVGLTEQDKAQIAQGTARLRAQRGLKTTDVLIKHNEPRYKVTEAGKAAITDTNPATKQTRSRTTKPRKRKQAGSSGKPQAGLKPRVKPSRASNAIGKAQSRARRKTPTKTRV